MCSWIKIFKLIFILIGFINQSLAEKWSDDARWLNDLMLARFADRSGHYPEAFQYINPIAQESRQQELYHYAFELAFDTGQLEEAKRLAELWFNEYPTDNDAELSLIRVLFFNKQQAEIIQHTEALLKRDNNPQIIAQISRFASQMANKDDKIQLFQALIERFPKNPYLYYYAGLIAKEHGEVNLALDIFAQASALDGNWRQLEIMQANVLSGVGRLREAQQILQKLLKKAPNDPELLSASIDLYADHYQWQQALPLAEKWLELQNQEPQILHLLAWLHLKNGDIGKSKTHYLQLLDMGEIDGDTYFFHVGQANKNGKNPKEALRLLNLISPHSPLYVLAQQESAFIAFQQKNYPEAQRILKGLRETDPEQALDFYAIEISQLREFQQDIQPTLKAIQSEYPNHALVLLWEAEALQEQNELNEAEKIYQKLNQDYPDEAEVIQAYANFLLMNDKRLAEVEILLNQAITAYPDVANIQDSYAQLLRQKNELASALDWQRRAYASQRSGEIVAHYIDLLKENAEHQLAKDIFQYEMKGQPNSRPLIEIGKKWGFISEK